MLMSLLLTISLNLGFSNYNYSVTGYADGQKTSIIVASIPSRNNDLPFFLESEAAEAFLLMHAAAARDGIELKVSSAYRTMSQQERLYNRLGPNVAAIPGHSNHQLGLAVDIDGAEKFIATHHIPENKLIAVYKSCRSDSSDGVKGWSCPTITYWWLHKNAKKFKFRQTVNNEKWHWVFEDTVNNN